MDKAIMLSAIMAKMLSKDELVEMLQGKIDEYNANKLINKNNDECFINIVAVSSILMIKATSKEPLDIVDSFSEMQRLKTLHTPEKS